MKSLASPTMLVFPDWNRPFTLHNTGAINSFISAGAIITQTTKSKEVVNACAVVHCFQRTYSRREPTEREFKTVFWGLGHFRQFLAGRCFSLVTDCSILTRHFRSHDLTSKLPRWALRLTEYEIVLLQWRAGAENLLSRRPSHACHSEQTLNLSTSMAHFQMILRHTH